MRFPIRPVAVAVVLTLAACGGGGSTTPTPPVVNATPTPVPTATPNPNVALYGCPLDPRPDLHNDCPKLTPTLADYVTRALDKTLSQHPELFIFQTDGQVFVKDRTAYHDTVVANIRAEGVCAVVEKEEIALKTTNDFNEQYNIWTAAGFVRRPPGAYITTCFPAQF
jgi:hypothetical protein